MPTKSKNMGGARRRGPLAWKECDKCPHWVKSDGCCQRLASRMASVLMEEDAPCRERAWKCFVKARKLAVRSFLPDNHFSKGQIVDACDDAEAMRRLKNNEMKLPFPAAWEALVRKIWHCVVVDGLKTAGLYPQNRNCGSCVYLESDGICREKSQWRPKSIGFSINEQDMEFWKKEESISPGTIGKLERLKDGGIYSRKNFREKLKEILGKQESQYAESIIERCRKISVCEGYRMRIPAHGGAARAPRRAGAGLFQVIACAYMVTPETIRRLEENKFPVSVAAALRSIEGKLFLTDAESFLGNIKAEKKLLDNYRSPILEHSRFLCNKIERLLLEESKRGGVKKRKIWERRHRVFCRIVSLVAAKGKPGANVKAEISMIEKDCAARYGVTVATINMDVKALGALMESSLPADAKVMEIRSKVRRRHAEEIQRDSFKKASESDFDWRN